MPNLPNEDIFKIIDIEGFSKNDLNIIRKYVAPEFIEHQFGFEPGIEGIGKVMGELHSAYPDFSMEIEEMVTSPDGDTVWGRITARGTQKGQIGPMPPTGKKMEITVFDVMRFQEGKMIEHWGIADRFAMMTQLGMKPPPKLVMKLIGLKGRLFPGK
jgi:predicted ester cyclase